MSGVRLSSLLSFESLRDSRFSIPTVIGLVLIVVALLPWCDDSDVHHLARQSEQGRAATTTPNGVASGVPPASVPLGEAAGPPGEVSGGPSGGGAGVTPSVEGTTFGRGPTNFSASGSGSAARSPTGNALAGTTPGAPGPTVPSATTTAVGQPPEPVPSTTAPLVAGAIALGLLSVPFSGHLRARRRRARAGRRADVPVGSHA